MKLNKHFKENLYIRNDSISQLKPKIHIALQITQRFNKNKHIKSIVINAEDFRKATKDLEFCDLKSDGEYLYAGDVKLKKAMEYKVDLINPIKPKSLLTVSSKDLKINCLGYYKPHLDCLYVFVEKSKTYIASTNGHAMLIHSYDQKVKFKDFVIPSEMVKYVGSGEVNIARSLGTNSFDDYTILTFGDMAIIQKTRTFKRIGFFNVMMQGRSKRINILPLKSIVKKYPKSCIRFEKNNWIISKDDFFTSIILKYPSLFKNKVGLDTKLLKPLMMLSDNCRLFEVDNKTSIQFKDGKSTFIIMPLKD